MKVDDAFLEDAVLNIYARCIYGRFDRRLDAGASINLKGLQEEWREYHLRSDDLERALTMLVDKGELELEIIDGERCYLLTEKGMQRGTVERRRSPRSIWQTLKDLTKLTKTQHRNDHAEGQIPQRRSTDQTAAQT